jgi:hypothetical protein
MQGKSHKCTLQLNSSNQISALHQTLLLMTKWKSSDNMSTLDNIMAPDKMNMHTTQYNTILNSPAVCSLANSFTFGFYDTSTLFSFKTCSHGRKYISQREQITNLNCVRRVTGASELPAVSNKI